ncbi:MAG TPA: galactokinase [Candidatus Omnitrophica bacterium]|nr:galactokinase [Candidatus Omnitrophota bacterium]
MTVIILAGGLGMRLRPAIKDQPKVLASVHGRPFIFYLLDQLARIGLKDVVLCTGYLGGQIQDLLGNSYGGMCLSYSQELSPLGTAGALRRAASLIRSSLTLVMNGDSYCDVDLQAFLDWHQSRIASTTLLLTYLNDASRYGLVEVNKSGSILSFIEKNNKNGPGWINAGIYLLRRDMILDIPDNMDAVSLERDVFPNWVGKGLRGYKTQCRFLDIGIPAAYAVAEDFFSLRGGIQ